MRSYGYADSGSIVGSLIITVFLWIVLTLCALFIKPVINNEPEYIEISITLSDLPPMEKNDPGPAEPETISSTTETAETPVPVETPPIPESLQADTTTKPVTTAATTPVPVQEQVPATTSKPTVQQTTAEATKPAEQTQTQAPTTAPVSKPAQTTQTTQPAQTQQTQTTQQPEQQTGKIPADIDPQPLPKNTTTETTVEPTTVSTTTSLTQQNQPEPTQNVVPDASPEPAPKTEIVQAVDRTPKETTTDNVSIPVLEQNQQEQVQSSASTEQIKTETKETTQVTRRELTEDEKWAAAIEAGLFDEEGFISNQNPPKINVVNNIATNELAGAASTNSNNSQQKTTIASSSGGKVGDSSESEMVTAAADKIKEAAANGSGSDSQPITNPTVTGTGGSEKDINWTGNSNPRKRTRPTEEPYIKLSSESERKIDRELELTISITVSGVGDISIDSIKISPLLQWPDVMDDIKQYITRYWRFEPDPKDQSGTATFKYSIKVNSK